jgi:putative membrane protein
MTSQAAGKTALMLALAIVTLGVAFGAAAADPQTKLSHHDAEFLKKAAAHGMAEVQLAQLAQRKAMREEVKEFADRMVADHGKANDEVKSLASANGVDLPAAPDRKHEKLLEKLDKLAGGDFDREYMEHMVRDHRADLKAFHHEAKTKQPNAVTEFAARTEPVIFEHLRMAQKTYDVSEAAKRTASREAGSTRK